MPQVLDAFLFTHEFDLLELRLRLLWPVVDKFLLMEGDHNFANQPKEMRFSEQLKRFEWAREKLIHLQHVGKFKDGPGELFVEHQHRQYLYDTAKSLPGFNGLDILMISDVDEIPSREAVNALKQEPLPVPILMHQDFYYYNIKCPRHKKWHGTMAMRFNHVLGDIGGVRGNRNTMPFIDKECGWHFAHFYDAEGIKEKLRHSSHRHYNKPPYNDPDYLAACVRENKNYLGKKDGNTPMEPLPKYLIDEMSRFPIFMGEEWR